MRKNMRGLDLIFIVLFILGSICVANAQHLPFGAESAGIAHASTAKRGRVGVYANPAGISAEKEHTFIAGYTSAYGFIEGLSTLSMAYLHSLSNAALSLSVYRFGDEIFSQHRLSISFGQTINHYSFGIRVNQHQFAMEGANTRYATAIDVGGMAKLSQSLRLGVCISNLNQAVVSEETQEKIPVNMSLGLSYTLDKKLSTYAELLHELEESPVCKVGLSYQAVQKMVLRCGLSTGDQSGLFFGLGLKHSILHIDYALEAHSYLGMSHHMNLAYKLNRNVEKE
ncbi:hypothetical protein PZB74_16340 [Porifericola rhodea]|uniref:hypothetical protein n=1 Tax=Porifericola rhodea TaxID=930972 RepID=UPI0026667D57|nr:hypothetical protein [Porifericola rhodea]WKN30535.1 hypothetical protein PZB74_16340 [Porifericola rhodea]